MDTSGIIVLKDQIGFGIYDNVEESFIGLLQKKRRIVIITKG